MDYSLFLAKRLSLSSSGRKSSPAVKVAVAAVALSVTVMLMAVAIVLGFKKEITARVSGFNSDLLISVMADTRGGDDYILNLTPSLRSVLDSLPWVTDYSLNLAAPAILKTPDDFKGIYFKSLSPGRQHDFISASVTDGRLPEGAPSDSVIAISDIAARQLGLKAGDKTDIYFITDQIRVRRVRIAAVFNTHFDVYDDTYIYGSPALLGEIGGVGENSGTTLSVNTSDFSRVEDFKDELQRDLNEATSRGYLNKVYRVESARDTGANYFNWLDMLDMNVVVVITLMLVVACVTLISGMLIVIVDKKRFIALMKALGMSGRNLRRVFIYLAIRVALVGLLIGDALAIGLILLQRATHLLPLDPDSYYIDFVPAELSWGWIVAVNVGTLVVAWLMLILPARFVGAISPARTLATE